MDELKFCGFCNQSIVEDGAYVLNGTVPMHRSCFVDDASDHARRNDGQHTVTVTFVVPIKN